MAAQKKITFHVFDPRFVENVLNSGVIEDWREEDAVTTAENRRRAAYKAKLTRSLKRSNTTHKTGEDADQPDLPGWELFRAGGPFALTSDRSIVRLLISRHHSFKVLE